LQRHAPVQLIRNTAVAGILLADSAGDREWPEPAPCIWQIAKAFACKDRRRIGRKAAADRLAAAAADVTINADRKHEFVYRINVHQILDAKSEIIETLDSGVAGDALGAVVGADADRQVRRDGFSIVGRPGIDAGSVAIVVGRPDVTELKIEFVTDARIVDCQGGREDTVASYGMGVAKRSQACNSKSERRTSECVAHDVRFHRERVVQPAAAPNSAAVCQRSGMASDQWRRLCTTCGGDCVGTEGRTDGGRESVMGKRCGGAVQQRVQQ